MLSVPASLSGFRILYVVYKVLYHTQAVIELIEWCLRWAIHTNKEKVTTSVVDHCDFTVGVRVNFHRVSRYRVVQVDSYTTLSTFVPISSDGTIARDTRLSFHVIWLEMRLSQDKEGDV